MTGLLQVTSEPELVAHPLHSSSARIQDTAANCTVHLVTWLTSKLTGQMAPPGQVLCKDSWLPPLKFHRKTHWGIEEQLAIPLSLTAYRHPKAFISLATFGKSATHNFVEEEGEKKKNVTLTTHTCTRSAREKYHRRSSDAGGPNGTSLKRGASISQVPC